MTEKKSPTQIAAQVAGLKKIKPSVRRWGMFGDNWLQIDAQIETLERGFTESTVDNRLEAEWSDEEYQAARDALNWRDEDGPDLIKEWLPLSSGAV